MYVAHSPPSARLKCSASKQFRFDFFAFRIRKLRVSTKYVKSKTWCKETKCYKDTRRTILIPSDVEKKKKNYADTNASPDRVYARAISFYAKLQVERGSKTYISALKKKKKNRLRKAFEKTKKEIVARIPYIRFVVFLILVFFRARKKNEKHRLVNARDAAEKPFRRARVFIRSYRILDLKMTSFTYYRARIILVHAILGAWIDKRYSFWRTDLFR